MKHSLAHAALFAALISSTTVAQAQTSSAYHPAITDRFTAAVGWFKSNNTFDVSAEGTIEDPDDDDIDFGDSLGVDEDSTLINVQLRYKMGKTRKWSIWGQYFENKASGEAVLEEDYEWQDVIFKEGSFVGAGVKIAIARIFVGRSFVLNERHDFGIGAGLHNLDLSTYIEGDIETSEGGTDFFRGTASSNQPLPNIGMWYNTSWHKNWVAHGRIDWISAKIGDYDGTMWNTNIGIGYQPWDHIGFDLSWQYFNLNVNVDSTNWRGSVDMSYSGPMLSLVGTW